MCFVIILRYVVCLCWNFFKLYMFFFWVNIWQCSCFRDILCMIMYFHADVCHFLMFCMLFFWFFCFACHLTRDFVLRWWLITFNSKFFASIHIRFDQNRIFANYSKSRIEINISEVPESKIIGVTIISNQNVQWIIMKETP